MLDVVVATLEPLLTLEEAKEHLRVDDDTQDSLITTYADAAVLACLNHCDLKLVPQGAEPVFKAAALLALGGLFNVREDVVVGQAVALNPASAALLNPYRIIRI